MHPEMVGVDLDRNMGVRWGGVITARIREVERHRRTGIPSIDTLLRGLVDACARGLEHTAGLVGKVFTAMGRMAGGDGVETGFRGMEDWGDLDEEFSARWHQPPEVA